MTQRLELKRDAIRGSLGGMLEQRGSYPPHTISATQPDPATVRELARLRHEGLFLQARALVGKFAPPETWDEPEAVVRGARALEFVGADRRALRLVVRLHRARPDDPFARVAYAAELLQHRGPLFAWRYLSSKPIAPPNASWSAPFAALMSARALCMLRDFDASARAREQAIDVGCGPEDAACERATWLDAQDRHDEAVEVIAQACREHPTHHNLLQVRAYLLHSSTGASEALSLLQAEESRFESAQLATHRAVLEMDQGDYAAAERSWQRVDALLPEAVPQRRKRLASPLADCAYHLGDLPRAIRLGREADTPPARAVADRLDSGAGANKRIFIDVHRVRQHRSTCAPATLTSLARWYGRPADHHEIAQAICYDGTRPHVERKWAQDQGWIVREFTLTWDSAVALLDLNLPFAVMTLDPLGGHMMTMAGYDSRRGTLLLIDPSHPGRVEVVADSFLEAQAPYGPRAMLIAPSDKAGVIDGVELADVALYDALHELNLALENHRRQDAVGVLARMQASDSGHRLVAWAERSLALYDGNLYDVVRVSDRLVGTNPNDSQSAVLINACLRKVGTRAQRVGRLEQSCSMTKRHPAVLEQLVAELAEDAREHERARAMARRLIRMLPERGAALGLLATIEWEALRFDEARELMRFAACLDPLDEGRARAHFAASRALGRGDEALLFLRAREQRWRARSSEPATTLFEALDSTNRVDEAFSLLQEALLARPDDGALALFAAVAHARQGRFEDAASWLERAQGKCAESMRHRARAMVAETRGELPAALAAWKELASTEPFAEDVQHAIARLLKLTDGAAAARAHARSVRDRYPHQQVLTRIWVSTLEGEDPELLDKALCAVLEADPKASWALIERALLLAKMGRKTEARATALLALEIEPANPSSHHVAGLVERRAGHLDEARARFESAFAVQADVPLTIVVLLEQAQSAGELMSMSQRLVGELIARSVDGSGFDGWYTTVADAFAPDELAQLVDRILEARPELWQSWAISVRHACRRGKPKRACKLAKQACDRFPGNTTLLLDAAQAWGLRTEADRELASLRSAYAIGPEPRHLQLIVDALLRAERLGEARDLTVRALQRAPMDPTIIASNAEVAWRTGEHDRAIDLMRRAVVLEPRIGAFWSSFHAWRLRRGVETGALDDVKAAIEDQPWNASLRLIAARVQATLNRYDDALATVQRAAELDPMMVEARDLEAELLGILGRRDQALKACDTASLPARTALPLRGRAIWLEAQDSDPSRATAQMERLLDEWPAYAWGIEQVVMWHDHARNGKAMHEAAERWVHVSPLDPEAHRVLGKVLMAMGRLKEARAALARATTLAPSMVPALANSVDAALSDGDPDSADEWASRIEARDDLLGAYWRMRIAAHRGDDDAMRGCVAVLLASPLVHPGLLSDVIERAWKRWRPEEMDEVLLEGNVTPGAVTAWAAQRCRAEVPPPASTMKRLREKDSDLYVQALSATIETLGERGHRWHALWYAARAWPTPRTHATSWGAVSFVMLGTAVGALVPLWLSRGPAPDTIRPWMLLNLALAWRVLFQSARAKRAHERALALEPDHTSARHHLFLSLDLAVDGDFTAARQHLAEAGSQQDGFDRAVRMMTEATLHTATHNNPHEVREAWRELGQISWEVRQTLVLSWMAWRARWSVMVSTRSWSLVPGLLWALPNLALQTAWHPAYRTVVIALVFALIGSWLAMQQVTAAW